MGETLAELDWDTADRLRKALRVAGVSVGEMADYLGVNRNTVGRYINGHGRPDRRTMRLWAIRCGVPLDWLQDGDERVLPRVDSNHQPAGWGMDLGGSVPTLRPAPVTVSGNVQLSGRDILALQRRFTRMISLGGPGRTAGRASADLPTGAAP
jgi:hypothetical protein